MELPRRVSAPTGGKAPSDATKQYQCAEKHEFTCFDTGDQTEKSYPPNVCHHSEHCAVPQKAGGSFSYYELPTHQETRRQYFRQRNNTGCDTKQRTLHEQNDAKGQIEFDRTPNDSLPRNLGGIFRDLTLLRGWSAHCDAESITDSSWHWNLTE